MSALAGIISALVALAGLAFKAWVQNSDVKGLKAQLLAETARADEAMAQVAKEQDAADAHYKHAKALETSLAEHLKTCRTPLAAWANQLRRDHKDSNQTGPLPNGPGAGAP